GSVTPRCSPSWPGDGCAASAAPWCRRFTAASMTTTPCWRGCCWTTTRPRPPQYTPHPLGGGMLLDHYDALTAQIDRLPARIEELLGQLPAAQVPGDGAGPTGRGDGGASGDGAH